MVLPPISFLMPGPHPELHSLDQCCLCVCVQLLRATSFSGSLVSVRRLGGRHGLLQESYSLPDGTFNFTLTGLEPSTLYQVGVALEFVGGNIGVVVTTNESTGEARKTTPISM